MTIASSTAETRTKEALTAFENKDPTNTIEGESGELINDAGEMEGNDVDATEPSSVPASLKKSIVDVARSWNWKPDDDLNFKTDIEASFQEESDEESNCSKSEEQLSENNLRKYLKEVITESHRTTASHLCATFLSALLTHAVSYRGPRIHPQITTMAVVTSAGAAYPPLITSVACGVYVGSVSPETIVSYPWLVLLASVTALVWKIVCFNKMMLGLSGRLGTTAFVAMNITAVLAVFPFSGVASWERYGSVESLWGDRLTIEQLVLIPSSCLFMSILGGSYRLRMQKNKTPVNPVLIPSALALLCMFITSVTEYKFASDMFDGYAVGTYVAMASIDRLSSTKEFATVGLIAGLWSLFFNPFFLGFGGKSGFTAMAGNVTYFLAKKISVQMREQRQAMNC